MAKKESLAVPAKGWNASDEPDGEGGNDHPDGGDGDGLDTLYLVTRHWAGHDFGAQGIEKVFLDIEGGAHEGTSMVIEYDVAGTAGWYSKTSRTGHDGSVLWEKTLMDDGSELIGVGGMAPEDKKSPDVGTVGLSGKYYWIESGSESGSSDSAYAASLLGSLGAGSGKAGKALTSDEIIAMMEEPDEGSVEIEEVIETGGKTKVSDFVNDIVTDSAPLFVNLTGNSQTHVIIDEILDHPDLDYWLDKAGFDLDFG